MAKSFRILFILISLFHQSASLPVPSSAEDIERLRLEGRQEWEIARSLPLTSLTPSFHPSVLSGRHQHHHQHRAHHSSSEEEDNDEAFQLPSYSRPSTTSTPQLNDEIIGKSRHLQSLLDHYAVSDIVRKTRPNHVPDAVMSGWFRSFMERLVALGIVEEKDYSSRDERGDREYRSWVSGEQMPMKGLLWRPKG